MLYSDLKVVMIKGGYVFSVFKVDDKIEFIVIRIEIIIVKGEYFRVFVIVMIVFLFDWFVGVDSIEFCGNDGKWKESVLVMFLFVWDVGIDSGMMFIVENVEIILKDVIKQIIKDSDMELKGFDVIKEFVKIIFVKYIEFIMLLVVYSIFGGVFVCLFVIFFVILCFLYQINLVKGMKGVIES